MICDFKKIIEEHNMLSHGDRVVVGLSGGADSMTLLHLLNSIRDEYSLEIVACHVNHLLRGDESQRDMLFVQDVCNKMGIPLETLVIDVGKEASLSHESIEECGRRVRYDFFNKISNGGKIATAHNLCDNEETVLMNLARGSGLAGLKGISYVRGNIIRPLLGFSRERIENYCSENDIEFVHDSSNDCDEYRRNFVRHNILPKIKEYEPAFDKSFLNFISLINDDFDYIDGMASALIEKSASNGKSYDVNTLLNAHRAVLSRALSKLIFDFSGVQPEKKHIDILIDALNSSSKKIQITGGIFAVIKNKTLYFTRETRPSEDFETRIDFDKEYSFFDRKIVLSLLSQKVYNMFLFDCIDCDKIVGDLILRNRRPGDRISLQKRNVSKTLKKLFCEDGIPERERSRMPVIADSLGVVWVEGYGCDNRCKTDENSKHIISVNCFKEDVE